MKIKEKQKLEKIRNKKRSSQQRYLTHFEIVAPQILYKGGYFLYKSNIQEKKLLITSKA